MTIAAARDDNAASPRRIRIVHAVETMELGGMERMIATLALAMNREQFDVQVLCIKSVGHVGDSLAAAGIPVHFAGLRGSSGFVAIATLARILRRLRADVVHAHGSCAFLFAAPGAWLAGVPRIVHTEHGRVWPDRLRLMVAERAASIVVDYVVGVSEAMTHALHRYERIPWRKLRTIANGVEPFCTTGPSGHVGLNGLNLPEGARLVGTMGRLVWEKGLSHLLDAWRAVREAEPNAVLLLAGDGPERAALEAQTDSSSLRESVRFLGVREDVPALLKSLDVFVMPSVSEGLPMALLEAMSAGLPIVATDIGGMPDALALGSAGTIVPPADPQALSAAIVRLLQDPVEASRLGAAAAATFRERFTADAMAHAYQALYLAGSNGANRVTIARRAPDTTS